MLDFPLGHGTGNIGIQGQFEFRLIFVVLDGRLYEANIGKGGRYRRRLDAGRQGLLFETRHIMVKIDAGLQGRT
ncbi:hypothetical protein D3C72_906840 [compost metagenome]